MAFLGRPDGRQHPDPVPLGDDELDLADGHAVMGVVNVTPDSFSDGGDYFDWQAAADRAVELVEAGADIVDIGGESTRPGADPVPEEQEANRVLPVVEEVDARTDAWISIDTTKSGIARRACEAGADIVNDISGLQFDDEMPEVVADTGAATAVMHIQGTPRTMQDDIAYDDVVDDLRDYFARRIEALVDAGIDERKIILDPGIGFGKTVAHNYRLLRELEAFREFGRPLLVGTSRKSFIGAVLDKPPKERIWGTAATVATSIYAGADLVRVHDVDEMRDVVDVTEAITDTGRH